MASLKKSLVAALLTFGLVGMALPAMAQDRPDVDDYPVNTITVTGVGTALGDPDTATLQVGVDTVSGNIAEAFAQSNTTIDAIVAAVRAAGVAENDVQTSNLNLYNETSYDPSITGAEQPAPRYHLSNTVNIIIRDMTTVQDVIQASIDAGATNMYGLSFLISEPAEQERSARVEAMTNARERAEQLAGLVGGSLGDVIIVNETQGSFAEPYGLGGAMRQADTASFINPGQSTIQIQVQVTFVLNR